jgi:hypothetical protein
VTTGYVKGTGSQARAPRVRRAVILVALAALATAGLVVAPPASSSSTPDPSATQEEEQYVLVTAGNIRCTSGNGVEATARLLDDLRTTHPGRLRIQTLGDHALPEGAANQFTNCYHPRWGRHKDITAPAIGQSEYDTDDGQPYRNYFGDPATHPGQSFNYSYDWGSWHIVVLNSTCLIRGEPGGQNSPRCMEQTIEWLQDDLQTNADTDCTMAVYNHPRYSSSAGAEAPRLEGLWQLLHAHGVDVVTNGRQGNYERFMPMNQFGEPDPNGMREFVAGTAGAPNLDAITAPIPGSEARNDRDFGVLEFMLGEGGYQWRFIPIAGRTFTDSGFGTCRTDTTAPVTNAHFDGPLTPSDWFIGPVEISLSSADPSGLASTEYDLDGSGWITYEGPFTVTAEGGHSLRFRSTDGSGNLEVPQTSTFRIDTTPPNIEMSVDTSSLWPPRGDLRDVGLRVMTDGMDPRLEVTSSERPGETTPDVVAPAEWTNNGALLLRAERFDEGPGRAYTVTATVSDEAGNLTSDHLRVTVPHDLSGKPLPSPLDTAGIYRLVAATGPDPVSGGLVRRFDLEGNPLSPTIDVSEGSNMQGAFVAACDVNGKTPDEVVIAPGIGAGAGSTITVRKTTGQVVTTLADVFPDHNGLEVACGDLDGDGRAEIAATPLDSPSGAIKILETDGSLRAEFDAYNSLDGDGLDLSIADIRGDRVPELVTAPRSSNTPGAQVKAFDVDGALRSSFTAFDDLTGGVQVAGGNVTPAAPEEIVIAPGPETLSPAKVRTYRADGVLLDEFGAQGIEPHLDRYGYHHIHDSRYGFNAEKVLDYTNFAHLGQPDFAEALASKGLAPLIELRLGDNEANWPARIAYLKSRAFEADFASARGVLVRDQVDESGWDTGKQSRAVALAEASFPGVPTLMIYTGPLGPGSVFEPPENLDLIGVDRFFPENFDNSGCTDRGAFQEVVDHLEWAAGFGKPVVMFGPSFDTPTRGMPSRCQQRWYMEAALSERAVTTFVWFMYGHVPEAIRGAGEFPDVLGWHRELYENVLFGGWGAEVSIANADGKGLDEIVVGNGAGIGNLSGVRAFTAKGEPIADSFVAFPDTRFGVELGAGRF